MIVKTGKLAVYESMGKFKEWLFTHAGKSKHKAGDMIVIGDDLWLINNLTEKAAMITKCQMATRDVVPWNNMDEAWILSW